jgi:hypothetical protein
VQINNIYSQAYVAGIFSLSEGACFASTQYLLSGLPVVSTKSKGGRDIWYNDENSIICEDNETDCYNCIQLAKQKVLNGEFDKQTIRANTIVLMNKFRDVLTDCIIIKLKDIFDVNMNKNELFLNLSIY